METISDEAVGGGGKWAERADDPKGFWASVAVSYAGGLFFIGRFFYQLFSN
jgi:hypothetical protein